MPISAPPPPKPKTPRSAPKPAGTPKTGKERRSEGLAGYLAIGQLGLVLGKQYADAETLNLHGPGLCDGIADYAEADERAAKYVDLIVAAGPVSALIAAALPMAFQFLANHKRLPVNPSMGIIPAEVLEMRFLRRAEEAKREAERQMAEFEAEMAEYRNEDRAREGNENDAG